MASVLQLSKIYELFCIFKNYQSYHLSFIELLIHLSSNLGRFCIYKLATLSIQRFVLIGINYAKTTSFHYQTEIQMDKMLLVDFRLAYYLFMIIDNFYKITKFY